MHEIKITQLGEGLTEVRIVELLKSVGDMLAKDEPLLEVETDKAVMQIETPYAGRLTKWLVEVGETVPVGATAVIVDAVDAEEASETATEPAPVNGSEPAERQTVRNKALSPRERAKLQAEGVADTESSPRRAAPAHGAANGMANGASNGVAQGGVPAAGQIWEMSPRQERLSELLIASEGYSTEAWMQMEAPWEALGSASRKLRGLPGVKHRPTPLELIAWCTVRAMAAHPKLLLLNRLDKGYEMQKQASLGIAVALPDDELSIAGIAEASSLSLAEFIVRLRANVAEVQAGRTVPGRCQLVVSYMVHHGVKLAVPRLIPPSVASLFIGAPFDTPVKDEDGSLQWRRVANFVLSFDHRVINGIGAAAFLKEIVRGIETLGSDEVVAQTLAFAAGAK